MVWDTARSQHTPRVRAVAALARIALVALVALPPSSPHRNRIERVGKCVKKTALADSPFADSPAFQVAIDDTLDRLGTTPSGAIVAGPEETV